MIPTRRVFLPISDPDFPGRADVSIDLSVLCATCRHWAENMTCAAFPRGIPRDIWSGAFDHRAPHPDDRGIRWGLAPGVVAPPELAG